MSDRMSDRVIDERGRAAAPQEPPTASIDGVLFVKMLQAQRAANIASIAQIDAMLASLGFGQNAGLVQAPQKKEKSIYMRGKHESTESPATGANHD